MKRCTFALALVLTLAMLGLPEVGLPLNVGLTSTAYAQGTPPACGGVFNAVADASVTEATPTTNRGDEPRLRVQQDERGAWRTLIRFDLAERLPARATIHSALLVLGLAETPQPIPYALSIRGVDATWIENTVTWNTQPALGADYGVQNAHTNAGTVNYDVTTLVRHWTTTERARTSLALVPTLRAMDVAFNSAEAAAGAFIGPRLVIRCALPADAQPEPDPGADTRQLADVARLKQTSTRALDLRLEQGVVRFALFDGMPAVGVDGTSRAQWFLNEYRGLLRLQDPQTQLQLKRRSGDGQHIFFRQRHQGIPVWPAEVAVHFDGTRVRAVSGDYLPEITLSPTPRLTRAEAERIALTLQSTRVEVVGDTQLRYVNLGLLGGPDTTTRLAWQVNLGHDVAERALMIDANTGELILTREREMQDFDLDLETANNTGKSPTCWMFTTDDDQWFDEDGVVSGANPDAEGFQAFANVTALYDFFNNTFGRDSYDDDGEDIAMYIHVNPHPGTASYNGGCDIFEFGNKSTVRDIMGHEFSHAIDESEGELEYEFQSGALDESFADIFGHAFDPGDWTVGEEMPGGAFRDMSNPPAFGDPDRMSDYRNLSESTDNGGVHTNSGIHNKAAFLLTDGGTFNGRIINGIGQSKARRLFYEVLTNWVGDNAKFADARTGAEFFGLLWGAGNSHGFTLNNLCQVRNTYAAVGIGQGDADCDGTLDGAESDNDGDYTSDGNDNCPNIANSGQGDVDGDGQGNACDADIDGDGDLNAADNCEYTPNANQADFNNDGVGDACDDSDSDGVKDSIDNCRSTANYDQMNIDYDALGDACDPDKDGDGVNNGPDNCDEVSNPGQQDSDNDNIGNACDLCPTISSGDNGDPDGDGLGNPCDPDNDNDGVLDGVDNCPNVENPNQVDFNQDGVGYACDEAEQEMMENIHNQRFESAIPGVIPLPEPDCIQCGIYLPNNFEQVINVALPEEFVARVIDSEGLTVAKSTHGARTQTLTFEMEPFAIDAPAQGVAPQANAPSADGVRYRLQIVPIAPVEPGHTAEISLMVAHQVPAKVHLPLVRR